MRVSEFTAFFNKEYRDQPDGPFLAAIQSAFLKKIAEHSGGSKPEHMFYADDCFVVYRNLGFLKDDCFATALQEANVDQVMLGRVWRLWVVAWSLRLRWDTLGAVVDFGTYNGKAFETAVRYCQKKSVLSRGSRGEVLAFDLFENPPIEARKSDHGPKLFNSVRQRLGDLCGAIVVRGELPGSLHGVTISDVTWAQIDLNSANADASVFREIFPKLVDGAVVIFDDYGFSRYRDTQNALDSYLSAKGGVILELPTGQGLYIHRI
jgi:O-methyltransferase